VSTHPTGARGWIGYDAGCRLCQVWVRRSQPLLGPRGFLFVPLQDPFWRDRLALAPGQIPDEMKLLLPAGHILGGAEAAVYLGRAVWWLAPWAWLGWLPGVRMITASVYRWIARHRSGREINPKPEIRNPK
jgi:predicted DCC family thiol-disulfide oxidoreductase YuxK